MLLKRFLIIQPFGIGDVLFTVPMIKNIKTAISDAQITFVANQRTAPLLNNWPEIQQVIIYDRDEFQSVYRRSKRAYFKLLAETKAKLTAIEADVAIDLSMTSYAAFYCWLAGIRLRIGPNFKNRSPWLTHKVPFAGYEGRHVVEYNLDLIRALGLTAKNISMELPISLGDHEWASRYLQEQNSTVRTWVAVFPGGGESWGADAKYKRWPAVQYAQLIEKLMGDGKVQIILMGNSREESLCKEIQSLVKYPLISTCGSLTIPQTMAVLNLCRLAVVNDGGALHMSVAAGTKTVSIFGPVDDKVYGPYPATGHGVVTNPVACRPCYRQFRRANCEHVSCIKNITVEDVYHSVKDLLIQSSSSVKVFGDL